MDIDALRPWIELRAGPASGPGGQHVNKVATRVTLLFDFQNCPALAPAQRARVATRLATRLSSDGRLRVVAQRERSQVANRRLAEERLLELLAEALRRRKPRIATRPTRASKRRRVSDKRQRGQRKRERGWSGGADQD